MLSKLHIDAVAALTGRGLLAFNKEMEKNVGRKLKYKLPPSRIDLPEYLQKTYTVVGVQKDYKGDLVYRVLCNDYNDTFGRCAAPDAIEFLD